MKSTPNRRFSCWPIAFLSLAWFGPLAAGPTFAADRPPIVVTDEARRVHAEGFVFDGHNDLPWTLRTEASSSFDKADIAGPVPKFHTDLPRLRKGGVGAVFWSVYVPAKTSQKGKSLLKTLEQIELVKAMVAGSWEERRVGKGVRVGWWPDNKKKKK